MSYKEKTPVKCSCSLRSLVGFDISETQAMTLVGVPIIDRKSNGNKDTVIGIVDAICYDKDLVYMTLYSYWSPVIQVDDMRKFQSFYSVSFEINRFEIEERFPAFFEETIWHDRDDYPEVYKDIIVRDADGKEYDNHRWTGHAYYRYVESEDGARDGGRSDIDIAEWRYKDDQ